MLQFLQKLFDTTDFPARWNSGHWTAGHGWLHIVSDLAVWSAYITIPLVLAYFMTKRRDLPFRKLFWLFMAFILACGMTHLMDAVVFWWPAYRLAGVIKLVTAIVSWSTVVVMIRMTPHAVALRATAPPEDQVQLRTAELANAALQAEIQERRRIEADLSRLAAIVESSDDAIIGTSLDGRITSWNRGAERMYGYAASEIIGRPFVVLKAPEPSRQTASTTPVYRSSSNPSPPPSLPLEAVRIAKDGRRVHVSVNVSPILEFSTGKIIGTSHIDRDISGRKDAEERLRMNEARYRSMVKAITSVEWTRNRSGQFTGPQPSWEAYTGQRLEEYLGMGWLNALHPEDRERIRELWERAVNECSAYAGEGRIWHAGSEQYRYYVARGLPLFNAQGEVCEFVGTVIDIHDRKQAELSLQVADRRKNEFLAMLGHELRNPLAPIRSAISVLCDPRVECESAEEALAIMERQVEHLVRLVDDLLDVGRIMRGRIDLRKEPVKLSVIVQQAAETVSQLAADYDHQLTLTMPDEPVWLHADSVRITQVLTNLLNNAVKYTPKGGRIELIVERELQTVVIRVRDNGLGVDPDLLPSLFDLFAQGDRSIERSEGGLGIGLTVVKQLVEMHGGNVRVFSDGPSRGSEFQVRLPLLRRDEEDESAESDSPQTVRPLRVLVMEDNVGAAKILAMMLKQFWQHEVRTAHDGIQGLAAAKSFQPDLVLCDIGLPGMSGYEVARRLREQPEFQETLLAALTGYGQDEDRQLALEAGFDAHLVKPASVDMLQQLFTHTKLTK